MLSKAYSEGIGLWSEIGRELVLTNSEPRWFRLLNLVFLPVGAIVCFIPDNGFAWILGTFFAAILAMQLAEHSSYFSVRSRTRLLMLGALCLTGVVRLLAWYILHGQPFWVIALIGLILSFPLRTWLVGLVRAGSFQEFLIRANTGVVLVLLFIMLRPNVTPLQGVLLLIATHDLYQAAFLLSQDNDPSMITFRRYYALAGVVGMLAFLGSAFHLDPIFHVIVVVLVGNTISVAFQSTLERKQESLRVDRERVFIHSKNPADFLRTMQRVYFPVILAVEAVGLVAVITFDLPRLLIRSNMQGNVFEASLSLVSILIAVLLFLKERGKGTSDRSTMNGLWSIIVLFLAIGVAAFVILAVSSGGAVLDDLPDLTRLTIIDLFNPLC